jgi:hypothetical protein
MILVILDHLEEEVERYIHQPPMVWDVCRGQTIMRLVTILVTMLVLIPLTSSGFTGGGIISNAQAANACSGEWQPVVWNETMQRVAEVPFQNSYNDYYYEDEYY